MRIVSLSLVPFSTCVRRVVAALYLIGILTALSTLGSCNDNRASSEDSASTVPSTPPAISGPALDSAAAIRAAIDALPFGEHRHLVRVVSFARDPEGYLVRLIVPSAGNVHGGGVLAWLDKSGKVYIVKTY